MSAIIEKFGAVLDQKALTDPAASRRLLVAGLEAFGLKLRWKPDPRLPQSRRYVAQLLNRSVIATLKQPQQAALTSVYLPSELLWAMGLRPMCAELYSAFLNGAGAEHGFVEAAEAAGIPETYCSYHKVLMGSAATGVLPRPAVIANTSLACDANSLTFAALAKQYGVPHFYVDVPPDDSAASLAYVADELREMGAFLERTTGRTLSPERLRTALVHTQNTIENFRAVLPLRRERSLPGDVTSEMYEIYTTHIALGTPEAERYSRLLRDDFAAAPPAHGLRLLWIHTIPFWQAPVRDTFNFSDRVQVVSCDMNFESLVDTDPDRPYESMARRLVESSWNGSGERRIAAALAMAKTLRADGVVCFCHWGCKQTMGISARCKKELEAAGFPTLILNGDGCDRGNSSDGQIATRVNAFLEMLEGQAHA